VSEPGAVVYVVGAETGAGQLLQEVILLIGAFGRGQDSDTVRAEFVLCFAKGLGGKIKGLFPADWLEFPVFPEQRVSKPVFGVNELMEMPAFGTEVAPADGMAFTGICPNNPIFIYLQIDSATAAAVIAYGHDSVHENDFSG